MHGIHPGRHASRIAEAALTQIARQRFCQHLAVSWFVSRDERRMNVADGIEQRLSLLLRALYRPILMQTLVSECFFLQSEVYESQRS